jgi:hypothetical protein
MVAGHVDKLIGIANLPNQRHKIVAKRCIDSVLVILRRID